MDCRGNNKCDTCGFNHSLKGRVVRQLKSNTEYSIKLSDGVSVNGSDKYIYFLENHCNIVGVCEFYKREDIICG